LYCFFFQNKDNKYVLWLTFYCMSILWKKWLISLKSLLLLLLLSNCYEIIKNASILIKLGTHVVWTIAFVTACSILNFLFTWQRGVILQNITSLLWFFPHQIRFQNAVISQWIETESKAFQRWLHVTLRSTLSHFLPLTSPIFS
jgi:hypothetical protein